MFYLGVGGGIQVVNQCKTERVGARGQFPIHTPAEEKRSN